MTKIKKVRNKGGEQVFPMTHFRAVRDDQGNTLEASLQELSETVNNMLASGYMYAGIAIPTTNPGTPASKCFFIAKEQGTYTNFNSLELTSGINILKWNGTTWSTEQVIGVDSEPTAGSVNLVTSGGVYSKVSPLQQIVDSEQVTKTDIIQVISPISGYVNKNGVTGGGDYINTGEISVSAGDKIWVSDSESTPKSSRFVCAKSNGVVAPTYGAEYATIYTVPEGINTVILSTASSNVPLYYGHRYNETKNSIKPSAIPDNSVSLAKLGSDVIVALDDKVNKESGKQLSSEDYTANDKAFVTELASSIVTDTDLPDEDDFLKITDNEDNVVAEITPESSNFKNLKSDGNAVLTNGNSITVENDAFPASERGDEMQFTSDDYDEEEETGELYAKVNKAGFFAKGYFFTDGKKVTSDVLAGKTWAVLGDSFTKGSGLSVFTEGPYIGKNKSYPYLISLRTGITIIDFFDNGRTLAFPAEPGTFVNSVTNPTRTYYYQNIPEEVDYITIYLGINDSHHAGSAGDGEDNTGLIPIGEINDSTTSTYYGAWNVVLSWLIENRPFAHIGIIVSNGCDTIAYREAQIAIATKYSIPYIDLNGDERTPFMIRPQNNNIPSAIKEIRKRLHSVDYDGTKTGTVNWHPNEKAHLFESYVIENFLRTI